MMFARLLDDVVDDAEISLDNVTAGEQEVATIEGDERKLSKL